MEKPKTEKPNPKTSPITPRVYSYIRFSTPEQAMGDSERRQLEVAEKYANDKGVQLDETLKDEGCSGYHGEHKKKGALGRFLIRVKNGNGEIPKNSILLVENIDRLGREPILDAFETVTSLIKNGVNIQTLVPYEFYDIKSVNSYLIYQLIGQMQRAHEESKRKSDLISQAREKARRDARETGKKLTARCPAWLDTARDNDDRLIDFKINPDAQETIKTIFDLKLKGIGKGTIAKRLNKEALWMPPKSKNKKSGGNGWRESYIQKILQNPAVIGEYQPYKRNDETDKREPAGEPIPNYYPEVIKPNVFYVVQEQFKKNNGKGGRTGKASNLFTHLVKCPYCNGSMAFVDKGKSPKGRKMLICDNGRRRFKCAPYSIQYDECEELILNACSTDLRPEEILPNPDEQSKRCQSLHEKIQGYIGKLRDIEKRINNYVNQIGEESNTAVGKLLKDKIREYQKQEKEIKAQQEEDEKEFKKAKSSLQSFDKWKKDLAALQKAIKKDNNVELRMRLRLHLRELIEKIEIFAVGLKENDLPDKRITFGILMPFLGKDGKDYVDVLDKKTWAIREKEYTDFCNYATKRSRASKEGRFLRVYFKPDSWCELWPKGSIPYDTTLCINEDGEIDWPRTSSGIKWLWDEYKNKKQ